MINEKNINLSIILISYNHASYIREAIESILKQKFNSKIQLIVADDKSTDRTLDIIREYDGIDNRFSFEYLSQEKNIGITKNYQRAFHACTGDYIAILEGDDIWANDEKLRKQIIALENNKNCVFCSSNYYLFNEKIGIQGTRTPDRKEGSMYYDVPFIIKDNLPGNFSAIVYRKNVIEQLPQEIFNFKSYDWVINIFSGLLGGFIYLHEPLSFYRIHEKGAWSSLSSKQKKEEQMRTILFCKKLIQNKYDKEFDDIFKKLKTENVKASWRNVFLIATIKRILKCKKMI